jgi:hypothetical protein
MSSLAFVREVYEENFYYSTFKHSKSLADLCKKTSSNDFQLGLEIALHALESAKQSAHSLEYNEILAHEIEKKTRSLQNSFTAQKKELEDQLSSLKSSLTQSDITLQAMKKGSDELLRTALSQKEEGFQKELARLKESHDKLVLTLEKSHTDAMTRADAQHAAAMDILKDQESRLRSHKVSSEKGKQGEKEFAALAADYFPWGASLINTSKTPHSADLKGKIRSCDVLFEVKMYSNDVPSKEVEKFERDLSENSNIPFGVMISLTSSIANKKDLPYITSKWSHKSQLLLFITDFYQHPSQDTLGVIDMCADIAHKVWSAASDSTPEDDIDTSYVLSSKIEQIKVLVDMEIKNLSEFSRSITHDKKFLMDKINESYTRYAVYTARIKSSLSQMIEIILGQPAPESPLDLPVESEPPSRKKSGPKKK